MLLDAGAEFRDAQSMTERCSDRRVASFKRHQIKHFSSACPDVMAALHRADVWDLRGHIVRLREARRSGTGAPAAQTAASVTACYWG